MLQQTDNHNQLIRIDLFVLIQAVAKTLQSLDSGINLQHIKNTSICLLSYTPSLLWNTTTDTCTKLVIFRKIPRTHLKPSILNHIYCIKWSSTSGQDKNPLHKRVSLTSHNSEWEPMIWSSATDNCIIIGPRGLNVQLSLSNAIVKVTEKTMTGQYFMLGTVLSWAHDEQQLTCLNWYLALFVRSSRTCLETNTNQEQLIAT